MARYPHLNDIYITDRLKERLKEIKDYRITTVIAPMGYGKTTAVKWWEKYYARKIPDAVIFRQIIATDSISDFWSGFCGALRDYPELSSSLQALGYPEDAHDMQVLEELLRDGIAAGNAPVYFVLDDVYILCHGALVELICYLMERLPEQIHMVLISRNEIFKDAVRLRLGSSLNEINADELRLRYEEIMDYADRCELPLSEEKGKMLASVSEGWISFVYLIFKSFAQKGVWQFDTFDIFKLIEEVMLKPLSQKHQDFLVLNSVTEDFTAEQAAFMWPGDDARELLDSLSKNNAFITYNDGGIYRYHHMLRQSARQRFGALSEEVKQQIYCRLGQWYGNRSDYLAAQLAYDKGEDWEALLTMIARDCGKSIGGEHQQVLYRWSRECPPEILNAHPDAILILMRKLFSFRQIPEMLRLKEILMESLATNETLTEEERNDYYGECELVMSFLQYNDISAMSVYHRKACAMMQRTSRCIDASGTWTFGSPSVLMMYHRCAGMLDRENGEMLECMPYYYQVADSHGNGAEYVMLAETNYLRGDFSQAEINYHLGYSAANRKRQYSILVTAQFAAMRMALFHGDYEKVHSLLEELRHLLKEKRQFILLKTLDLCEGWVLALLKAPEKAASWLLSPEAAESVMHPATPMLQMVCNQLLLAKGELLQLLSRRQSCHELYEASHCLYCDILLSLQCAAAAEELGRREEALAFLQKGLEAAVPDRLWFVLAEFGAVFIPLLEILKDKGLFAEEIPTIINYCEIFEDSLSRIRSHSFGITADYGFTEREKEIALLAAARKTNKEIAAALFLSEATVKNHLNRIFDKMGISGSQRNKRILLAEKLQRSL